MENGAANAGYRAGLCAFAAAVAYDAAQILQVAGVLRFPLDEILIYGTSLCIVVPFLLEILAVHHTGAPAKRYWTHAALVFAVLYAVFVTANYAVQLATVIPAKMRGMADAIRILDQTPHSLFWDYDAIGYIAMGFACLFLLPSLERTGFEKRVRPALIAHVLVTPLIGIVYFHPAYSAKLLFLGFPWAITAPLSMLALALMLRRRGTATEA